MMSPLRDRKIWAVSLILLVVVLGFFLASLLNFSLFEEGTLVEGTTIELEFEINSSSIIYLPAVLFDNQVARTSTLLDIDRGFAKAEITNIDDIPYIKLSSNSTEVLAFGVSIAEPVPFQPGYYDNDLKKYQFPINDTLVIRYFGEGEVTISYRFHAFTEDCSLFGTPFSEMTGNVFIIPPGNITTPGSLWQMETTC